MPPPLTCARVVPGHAGRTEVLAHHILVVPGGALQAGGVVPVVDQHARWVQGLGRGVGPARAGHAVALAGQGLVGAGRAGQAGGDAVRVGVEAWRRRVEGQR